MEVFALGALVPLGACSYGILSTFAKLAYAEGFTPAEVIGAEMPVTDAHPVKPARSC